jgi:energy-coupling factor transport system permease protein
MVLMVLPFVAPGAASSVLLSLFVAALLLAAAVPPMSLLRTMRTVFWTGLFMFVFRFFSTPGTPLLQVGPVSLTWEGLVAGLQQIYRLCFLVAATSLLTFTTSPAQLTQGIESVLKPLQRVGLPVRELGVVLTIALRFVPTLLEEVDRLVKAQESRGAAIRSGPLLERLRGWSAVFVPVFISAYRRADDLATAMEARGFRSAAARTHLHRLEFGRRDVQALLAIVALSTVVVLLEWYS